MIRFCTTAFVLLCLFSSSVLAQTVRFETNVGSFEMVLNPNDDENLQPLVDNLIAYVGLGRYHFSAINRAADNDNSDASDDFVLQMGGFSGFAPDPDMWARLVQSVESLEPVETDTDGDGEVDFTHLSNTVGTVSMALAAGDVNSGTSSFFINLGDNSFLDDQGFVPFAEIKNMATIDKIMGLEQADLSSAVGSSGSLAFVDVPLTQEELIVVVKRAYVVESDSDFSFVGPIASALQLQQRNEAASTAAAIAAADALAASSALSATTSLSTTNIPEPTSLALLAPVALWGLYRWRRR